MKNLLFNIACFVWCYFLITDDDIEAIESEDYG